jgi:PAS domain S-box-containing protein
MTLTNKRILSYIATCVVLALFGVFVTDLGWHSNPVFHTNICIIDAMIGLFTGFLALVRYYAKKGCPYLWVALAFLGIGIIEGTYAYAYAFRTYFLISRLENFMVWGWWLGKLYFSIMMLCAYLTCRKNANTKHQEKLTYAIASVMILVCLGILLFTKLPDITVPGVIARPLEFINGFLLVIALVGFFRLNTWMSSAFSHWLIISLILCAFNQFFIVPLSAEVYDIRFMAGNIIRALSHILVAIGLQSEIFKLYRKMEEETVKLSALRLAVSQVSDYAVYMLDTEGRIVTWNKGAEHIKGYTEAEILGEPFSKFYPEEDIKAGKPEKELHDAVAYGHYIDEGWRIRKDHTRFWAYFIITPIYNEARELIGFSKITRDLTEHKIVEEEMRLKNRQLTQSNEQLQQFAYIATHDLKEPLRSITSFTELLIRECQSSGEKAGNYAQFIVKAVERTRRLIDDLRTYSMIGMQQTEQTDVDLNQCLQDAMNLLKKKIEESRTELHTAHLPTVEGSPSQFMYLFLHFIDNAIKYGKPGIPPVIKITYTTSGNEYVFSIADNGVGIAKEYEDRIFTIFQKLVRRDQTSGSGIGLSICKQVVQLHGGRIWFASSEKGTTFYFSLPMHPMKKLNE